MDQSKVGIEWGNQFKYLGVIMGRRLNFIQHINKTVKIVYRLSRLMPNVSGPRESKRKLLTSVVYSKVLYTTPVWTNSLEKLTTTKILLMAQLTKWSRQVDCW